MQHPDIRNVLLRTGSAPLAYDSNVSGDDISGAESVLAFLTEVTADVAGAGGASGGAFNSPEERRRSREESAMEVSRALMRVRERLRIEGREDMR